MLFSGGKLTEGLYIFLTETVATTTQWKARKDMVSESVLL